MCSLPHSLQLHNRLDAWPSFTRYPGVQVGANVNMSDLAYADNIMILDISYRAMLGLLEAVNRHAAAVDM